MENIVQKLDSMGKPAWIGLMVLSFILFWPIGLAVLAYLIWSGRMGHRHRHGRGRWHFEPADGNLEGEQTGGRCGHRRDRQSSAPSRSSGNLAFDEYREETLKRLEQEQQQFTDFLERLRFAKDKSEFDQFLADRRNVPAAPEGPEAQAPGQP
ncbi:MAG: DUF2852 domain-containing protein [Alphaproteobacteria bacterium]